MSVKTEEQKAKNREQAKAAYHRNREAALVLMRERYYKNREKYRASARVLFYKNREERNQISKVWRDSNMEKVIAYRRAYYAVHKLELREKVRIKAHNDRAIICEKKRSRYKENGGKEKSRVAMKVRRISKEVEMRVLEENIRMYGLPTCYLCNKRIDGSGVNGVVLREDWNLEHRVPINRSGTNDLENLALSCKSCNLSKGRMTEDEYRKSLI